MVVDSEDFEDCVDGLAASEFERAKDGHQHGLCQSTSVALVRVAVFADHHGGANRSFARVVVRCHLIGTQEPHQLAVIFLQPLRQAFGIGLRPVFDSEVDQAAFQTQRLDFVISGRQRDFLCMQFIRIAIRADQSTAERRPFLVIRELLVHGSHIAQQVWPAFLLISAVSFPLSFLFPRVVQILPKCLEGFVKSFGLADGGSLGPLTASRCSICVGNSIGQTPQTIANASGKSGPG